MYKAKTLWNILTNFKRQNKIYKAKNKISAIN